MEISDEEVDLSESCRNSGVCKNRITLVDSYLIQNKESSVLDKQTEPDSSDDICKEVVAPYAHATTIGTIVVRCGPIQLVIALLQSLDDIFIKVVEVEPKITVLGLSYEDSFRMQKEHDDVLQNLQNLPGPMDEFVLKADKLLAKKRISSELVKAMAGTINIIWQDIINLMNDRHRILYLCTQFHVKMSDCFVCMHQLEEACLDTFLPATVMEAQELLNRFKQMRIDMLTAVMAALKDGNELLAELQGIENKETLDTRPEHIKRDAMRSVYQVQQWLESLHDRRNILEVSWQKRKIQLEKCLALALLSCELIELENALSQERNSINIISFSLGECEHTAKTALQNYHEWKLQALQFRDRGLKITRAKEKLHDSGISTDDEVCARAYAVLSLCTEHLNLVDQREHWLQQAREFFSKAEKSLLVLEKLELELLNTQLTTISPNTLPNHSNIAQDVENFTKESLIVGNAIVNEAGFTPLEVQGVKRVLNEIENRKKYIESICVASNQSQQRVQEALLDFFDQYDDLLNWIKSTDKSYLQRYRRTGKNLEEAKEFLLQHHVLMQDLEMRGELINKLLETIKVKLDLLSVQQRYDVDLKAEILHRHWIELKKNVLNRVDCVSLLIVFFENANELHSQLDDIEKHLKQTPEKEKLHLIDITWENIQSRFNKLKEYGINFINIHIEDPYMDTKYSADAVNEILDYFSKYQSDVETSVKSWTSHMEINQEIETMLETIISQNEETASKTTKVDSQLYPVFTSPTIDKSELYDLTRAKLLNVNGEIEIALNEIQQRIQAALSIQAETKEVSQKIQEVIKKLEALKSKLNGIKYDYQLLLENMLQFLENAKQLKCIINQYFKENLPEKDIQEVIGEHKNFCDACMNKFRTLITQSELLIDRVRISEPVGVCEIDIDCILKILERLRIHFESNSNERMLKLELLEMLNRFKSEINEFEHSLNKVQDQLYEINEQKLDNLATAKTSSLAFEYFERTVELLGTRISTFTKTTLQPILINNPETEAYVNNKLKSLTERWQTIKEEVQKKRLTLNREIEFFEVIEKIETEYHEVSYFFKCVSQKVPNISDPIEALNLINDIEKYVTSRQESLNSKLDLAAACSRDKIKVSNLYNDVLALFQSFTKLKSDIKIDHDQLNRKSRDEHKLNENALEERKEKDLRNEKVMHLTVSSNILECDQENPNSNEFLPPVGSTSKTTCEKIEFQKRDLKEQTTITELCSLQSVSGVKDVSQIFTNPKYTLPYFKSPLKDAIAQEGEKCKFECEVAGDPEPQIEWFKDGILIHDNNDYKMSYDAGYCTLLIEETLVADSAQFGCRASNIVGSITCTALLSVKENINEVETDAPRFVQILNSGQTTEGSCFQFSCLVSGNPLPTVQWFKNDKCIDDSADYVITYNNGEAILKFLEVFIEDEAVYTCRATNIAGIEHCSASLFVKPLEPTEKPFFKIPLSNAMVRVGQKIKLEALLHGIPQPDVYWLHNGKPCTPREAKYEHGRVTLIISNAYPKDAGVYVLIAKNIAGEVNTMCTVNVKGRLQNETSDSEIASDIDPIPPAIQMPLKDVLVFEGKSICLDCVIIGQPEPEVIWYHNDQPIKESADVQLLFQGDRCSLIIQEVFQEDAGIYKVVAINSAGETSSNCNITVAKLDHKPQIQLEDSTFPNFQKFLTDVLVNEGEKIELEVTISGDKPLSAKWFFANNELFENEHIMLVSNYDTRVFKLIIRNATVKDNGLYMVQISNNVGDAKCFSNVIVKSNNLPKISNIDKNTNYICPEIQGVFANKNVNSGDLSTEGKVSCTAEKEVDKATCEAFLNLIDLNSQAQPSTNSVHTVSQEHNNETSCVTMKKKTLNTFLVSQVNSFDGKHLHTKEDNFFNNIDSSKMSLYSELNNKTIDNTTANNKTNISTPYFENSNLPSFKVSSTCLRKEFAPSFTTPLSGKIVEQGTDVIMDAKYDGFPTPEILIEKNGEQLVENINTKILMQKQCVKIEIKDTCASNAGRYTIKVFNKLGHSTTTADLVVKKTTFPPVFGKRLQAQIAKMGDKIIMDVEVTGLPDPLVLWYKDDTPLEIAGVSEYRLLTLANSSKLIIEKAHTSDSGKYMVKATNTDGEAKSIADLAVLEFTPDHNKEDLKLICDDMPSKFKTEIYDKHPHHDLSLSKIITEHRCVTEETLRLEPKSSNVSIPSLSNIPKTSISGIQLSPTIPTDKSDYHQGNELLKSNLVNGRFIKANTEACNTASEVLPQMLNKEKYKDQHENLSEVDIQNLQPSGFISEDTIQSIDITAHNLLSELLPPPRTTLTTLTTQTRECENRAISEIDQQNTDTTLKNESNILSKPQNSTDSRKFNVPSLMPEVPQSTPSLNSAVTPPILMPGSPPEICYAPKALNKGLKIIEGENFGNKQITELKYNSSNTPTSHIKYSFKLNNNTFKTSSPVLFTKMAHNDYCESDYESDRWKLSGSESDDISHYLQRRILSKSNGYTADTEEPKLIEKQSKKNYSGIYYNSNQENLNQSSASMFEKKDYELTSASLADNTSKNNLTKFEIRPKIESPCEYAHSESANKETRSPFPVLTPTSVKTEMGPFLINSSNELKVEYSEIDTNNDMKNQNKEGHKQYTYMENSPMFHNKLKQINFPANPSSQFQFAKPTIYYNAITGPPIYTVSNGLETKNSIHIKDSTSVCKLVNTQKTNYILSLDSEQVKDSANQNVRPYIKSTRKCTNLIQQLAVPTKFIPGDFRESDYESEVDNIKINSMWSPYGNKSNNVYRHVNPPQINRSCSVPLSYDRVISPMEFDHGPEMPKKTHIVMIRESNNRFMDTNVIAKKQIQSNNRIEFIPSKSIEPILKEYESKVGSKPMCGIIQCQGAKHIKVENEINTNMKFNDSAESIGVEVGLRRDFKRSPSEGYNQVQSSIHDSQVSQYGTKCIDPKNGLVYFKYDFGYEFGILFPGKDYSVMGSQLCRKDLGSSANPKLSSINKPQNPFTLTHDAEVIIPVKHESTVPSHGIGAKTKMLRSGSPLAKKNSAQHKSSYILEKKELSIGGARTNDSSMSVLTPGVNTELGDFTTPKPINSNAIRNDYIPKIPYFSTPLKDIAVKTGCNARFECIVESSPELQIVWSRNGEELEYNNHVHIEYKNGICRLTLIKVYQHDAGNYTCSATNSVGGCTTSGNLDVSTQN